MVEAINPEFVTEWIVALEVGVANESPVTILRHCTVAIELDTTEQEVSVAFRNL